MPLVSAISGPVPAGSIALRGVRDGDAFHRQADGAPKTGASGQPASGNASASSRDGTPWLGPKRLDSADQRMVEELARIDRQVRAHEAAHQAAAGSLGGAVSFTYRTGPDGKTYAVGGEVPIVISSGDTPDETIARAEQVRAAALAPADPSPQDLAVAAQASEMEAAARAQKAELARAAAQSAATRARGGTVWKATPDGASAPALGRGGTGGIRASSPAQVASAGLSPASSASAPSSPEMDVGAQVAALVARLQSEPVSADVTTARTQQLARLAAAAYRR